MLNRVIAAGLFAAGAGGTAWAQDGGGHNWFARTGITGISMADGLKLSVGGAPVPGADDNTKFHVTPTVQIGHFIGDDFAISLTVGVPPHIKVKGKGTLAPYGTLAETTYGPSVLTLQYRPLRDGSVQPYLGAGLSYMIVFDADDGAFQNVKIDNDIGPAVEAGTDIMLTDRYGLFLDVKKVFLRTDAHGTFGGAPVEARAKLDPWAFSIGGVVRF